MEKHIKKHFIFDLDDTLVDGRLFCGETMARAINHYEPHIDPKLVIDHHENVRGRTIDDLYKSAIEDFNLKTPLEDLLQKDAEIMAAESDKIVAFEGVKEIFEILSTKGKKLHLCTNRMEKSLFPILKNNEIENYFENVVSCIDRGYKKPNPTCLLEIIEKTGDPKDTFIYFGDSEIDYLFAKNAGIEHIIFDQYLNGKTLFKKLINVFLD